MIITESLDEVIALATKKRMSPLELFEHFVALEEADGPRRSLERRAQARLNRLKPISDFD